MFYKNINLKKITLYMLLKNAVYEYENGIEQLLGDCVVHRVFCSENEFYLKYVHLII